MCSTCIPEEDKKWHTDQECNKIKGREIIMEAIMPLRLVTEANANSEVWSILRNLYDHVDNRIHSEDWKFFHDRVSHFKNSYFFSVVTIFTWK